MITFHCQCGKAYQVGEQNAGREVRCRCGQNVTVPAVDAMQTHLPVPPPAANFDDLTLMALVEKGPQSLNYDNHRFVRVFARGGMGRVSVALDEKLKREVALKELFENAATRRDVVQRFLREAEITARLEHPGIVPVYTSGTDAKGRPYYTMKLVQGMTFQEAIQQYHDTHAKSEIQTVAFRDLIRRFASVCQTIAFAHKNGIIHRDLKPANIMLGEYGETLVLDWGLAKPYTNSGASTGSNHVTEILQSRPEVTEAGRILGTAYYMSPEQASGDPLLVGPPSDIYSLGVILYQVLTNKLPHTGHTSREVIKKILRETPQSPSEVVKGVPKDLEAICLTAMAREPKERYKTATSIYQDLMNWLDDVPISIRKETRLDKAWRWVRKNTTQVTTLIFAMFVLVVVLGVGGTVLQRAHRHANEMKRQAEEALELVVEKEEGLKTKEQELESLQEQFANLTDGTEEWAALQTRIAALTNEINLLRPPPLTADEYRQIREKYPELELSENMADYNIIVLQELTDTELRRAITVAGNTIKSDLIIARTLPNNNRIVLGGTEIRFNVNVAERGRVTLVALGNENLVLDADRKSRVIFIDGHSHVGLAGLTIKGGSRVSNYRTMFMEKSAILENTGFFGGGIFNIGTLVVTNCVISENLAQAGGGIYNQEGAALTIIDSIVSENLGVGGGGIHSWGELTVTNSKITENSATQNGGGIESNGALTLKNSTISENLAHGMGGGIRNYGTATVSNCMIFGNTAPSIWGGGVDVAHNGTVTVSDSTISGNSAGIGGGGFSMDKNASLVITNSVISRNTVRERGGGIHAPGSLTVTNCTITGNTAAVGGGIEGGTENTPGKLTLNNTIVAENFGGDIHLSTARTVQGDNNLTTFTNWVGGTANLLYDPDLPLFARNYRLAPNSQAIDKGNNQNALDAGLSENSRDRAGNPRFIGESIDIGAYEYDLTGEAELPPLTADEYRQLREKYPELELSENMADYNVITLQELTDEELRWALEAAGDTIEDDLIVARTTPENNTITLNGTEITININAKEKGSVTLVGFGEEKLTIDADKKSRVFSVVNRSSIRMANIHFTNGYTDSRGGAMYIYETSIVRMHDMRFSKNILDNSLWWHYGGALCVEERSYVHLSKSVFDGNHSNVRGGAISIASSEFIGDGLLFINNRAGWNGGGIFIFSAFDRGSSNMFLSNSSFIKNSCGEHGGAIAFYAPVSVGEGNQTTAVITNVTIAHNHADADGGGIFLHANPQVTMNNVTIVGNQARFGAGLHAVHESHVTLNNSIVANNTATDRRNDVYMGNNAILTGTHNIIGMDEDSNDRIVGLQNGENFNRIGTQSQPFDAGLGPLRDFGNGIPVITLSPNSPAIDAGAPYENMPETDAAGNPRVVGTAIDIGAYEYQGDDN